MQNFSLLKRAGESYRPILLKRGMAATIEEFLLAAEYILAEGNPNVILCERGIRTFEGYTRNTLDISAIPVVQKRSHLPILVDPSHGTGRREKVIPMARAAVAAGADGLIPVRSLGSEFFHFDRESQTLMGADTGLVIALGQKVTVRLAEAVPVTGGLMLELLALDGTDMPSPVRGRRKGSSARKPAKALSSEKGRKHACCTWPCTP